MRLELQWNTTELLSIQDVASDTRLFELKRPANTSPFTPGAHVEIGVLINNRPETRSYSLIGFEDARDAQQDAPLRIAVKKMPASRGGSDYMWSLKPGTQVSLTQPNNNFDLSYNHEEYLLIAGGIGITPIYGMALALKQRGANFKMLYGGRKKDDMAFAKQLKKELGKHVVFFSEDASDEKKRTIPFEKKINKLKKDAQLYICGPLGMMDAAREAWQQAGRADVDFRCETFGASGHFAPEQFDIFLPRFGKTVTVPQNMTILEALRAENIDVISDCEKGECGLCVLDILKSEGEIDHRDVFFSAEQKAENNKICACVSRFSGGNATLDTSYRGASMPEEYIK